MGTTFLDLIGGIFSLAQMVLLAWDHGNCLPWCINYIFISKVPFLFHSSDDWSSLYGNIAKLGLGLISLAFDFVFIVQHYILYRYP